MKSFGGALCRLTSWHVLVVGAILTSLLVGGCGGGGGLADPPAAVPDIPLQVMLQAVLFSGGTFLTCSSNQTAALALIRKIGAQTTTEDVSCPFSSVLSGDLRPSGWALTRRGFAANPANPLAQANTELLPPVVIGTPDRLVAIQPPVLDTTLTLSTELEYLSSSGNVLASFASPFEISTADLPSTDQGRWRWAVRSASTTFVSDPVDSLTFTERNLGGPYYTALAVGDLDADGKTELLGFTAFADGAAHVEYQDQGLDALLAAGRNVRDIRIADLNGDGLDDIVSNVYGQGCTLIGLNNGDSTYQWITPLRDDGSCIGGHGETVLVADFDGDGLLDIFLPSYERYDLLRNLGNGQFVEIGDSRGLSYPRPINPEGAAAVDIDLDGDVDIVVGNDVLLNDGHGFFTPIQPFPTLVHDEGLAVFDIDGDGVFDVIKNDPSYGPRIFWGAPDGMSFGDSGWLLGGEAALNRSNGLVVGYLTNDSLADFTFGGGDPAGTPPTLCVQGSARQFQCLRDIFPIHTGMFQDLLLIADLDGDGENELVSRWDDGMRVFSSDKANSLLYQFDIRDSTGKRTLQGRSARFLCAVDGSLLGLRTIVNGGNGYMAQSNYAIRISSPWCPAVNVEVPTATGTDRFGPFSPNTGVIRLNLYY